MNSMDFVPPPRLNLSQNFEILSILMYFVPPPRPFTLTNNLAGEFFSWLLIGAEIRTSAQFAIVSCLSLRLISATCHLYLN